MGLKKCKLGYFIEKTDKRNSLLQYGLAAIRGVSNDKKLMPTRADLNGRDISKFKIVSPGDFVFNHRTSRHGGKFCITYNNESAPVICTEDYTVFSIKAECVTMINPMWLYLFFCRPEFDRFVMYSSWGSSTEFYGWEDICDFDFELPDIKTQQKYVDIYKAMVANQQSYERGLEDLKLVCDGYIEDLRRKMPCEKIGVYLRPCNERNDDNSISLFQGVNVDHVFIDPKRVAEDAENGSVVRTGQFAFNKVMKAHNTKLPFALREGPDCVVSNSYQVFEISDKEKLLPKYLLLWMNRTETQRYAGFISFGTTRDVFSFEDLCDIAIPLPDTSVQRSIAEIFEVYQKRTAINEKLKAQIKYICPILVKGSLEEGK